MATPIIEKVTTLESKGIYLLSGDITEATCTSVIRFLLETNIKASPDIKDIKLIINSGGGDLQSALALTDIMDSSNIPIKTYGLGTIASAALVLFMSGAKGFRTITKNTSILSHQWTWGATGKQHELIARNKEFELLQKRMLNHYKLHTGLTETKIRKELLPPEDRWLTAEEAVKLKIADIITDFKI